MEPFSKFIGKKSHSTFYISHRHDAQGLNARAYYGAESGFQPLRELAGGASFIVAKDAPKAIYSANSVVVPEFRREGILSAIYDHMEDNGWTVHPADGSVGDVEVQAQSPDAKAFWKARNRGSESLIEPCDEREFHGWDNPYRDADEVLGRPVHQKVRVNGYTAPMLVLWGWNYAKGPQRVGVIYLPERGYRVCVLTGEHDFDIPDWNGHFLSYSNGSVSKAVMAKTADQAIAFYHDIRSKQ